MYKCPDCGGALKFDIATQQLKCDYCNNLFDPYSIKNESDAEQRDEFDVTIFSCPQCGARILGNEDSISNFCSFCGASTILSSQLGKEKRPGYIIPFKRTKEDCKKIYKNRINKAIFAPKELRDSAYIDGFRGIYMPYWVYHFTDNQQIKVPCSKSYRRGDYVYTDHYKFTGDLDCSYKGLSYDASSTFDDTMSEKIAPYDVKNMNNFTPTYLSGFYADSADVKADIYMQTNTDIADEATKTFVTRKHIPSGYTEGEYSLNTKCQGVDMALFPVWFLSYRNKDRVAYAIVNGQTGKILADLPISLKKYFVGSIILALPIFLLLNIFMTFIPSVTLTITSVIALITAIIYNFEVKKINQQESGVNDIGRTHSIHCDENNEKDKYSYTYKNDDKKKSGKKKNNKKILNIAYSVCTVIFLLFMYIMFSDSFSVGQTKNALIITLVILIASIVTYFLGIKNKTENEKLPSNIWCVGAVGLAFIIQVIRPVSDIYYYMGCILSLIAIIISLVKIIKIYNILATRKLPQFNIYKGGNDGTNDLG